MEKGLSASSSTYELADPSINFVVANHLKKKKKYVFALTCARWLSQKRKMQFLYRYKLPGNLKANENLLFLEKKPNSPAWKETQTKPNQTTVKLQSVSSKP